MFSEPSFPMAGKGIFKHITALASKDAFENKVDLANSNPNIGASNANNLNLILGLDSETNMEREFNIYPNPVKDDINLFFKKYIDEANLYVYSIQGKLVHSVSSKSIEGDLIVALPQSIKNGIYFLKIQSSSKEQTSQFILYR